MTATPTLEHRFNDDLLISPHDQDLAKREFTEIYHVLDHPELREEFLKYDTLAICSRLWVQRLGLFAVLLTVFALLGSAITPLLKQVQRVPEWILTLTFWSEVGGLVGLAIAAGGILISGRKKTWLEARMMAEVLRLWHFQSLICRGKEIESSCQPGNAAMTFKTERDLHFRLFLREWGGSADSHLLELIEKPGSGYQLLHDGRTAYTPGGPVIEKVLSAYKSMRFRHQANYARHKLQKQTDKPLSILKWPAALLQSRMQAIATSCLLASLICSVLIVVGHAAHLPFAGHTSLPIAIVVLLVLTVASRALQDGLAAPEEFQRYNDYAGKVEHLLGRFEMSPSDAEKVDLMIEMERAAIEELKGFLRAHYEARFVV